MPTISSITAEQKAFYATNGYLVIKGLFSREEANAFRTEAHDLIGRLERMGHGTDATWESVRRENATKKKTVISHCHDVHFQSAAFSRLIVDPRLMTIAQGIIGPNVQLHHTKLFIKPPENGSPFPMHQDVHYFPHTQHSMIAAIVHFDDAPIEKGCFRVVPGSHKLGPIPSAAKDHSLPPGQYSVEAATPLPCQAGDVAFFSYLTIHGSGVNTSNEPRTTMLVQMRDPSDLPTAAMHLSLGQGMMLAGIDPTLGDEYRKKG